MKRISTAFAGGIVLSAAMLVACGGGGGGSSAPGRAPRGPDQRARPGRRRASRRRDAVAIPAAAPGAATVPVALPSDPGGASASAALPANGSIPPDATIAATYSSSADSTLPALSAGPQRQRARGSRGLHEGRHRVPEAAVLGRREPPAGAGVHVHRAAHAADVGRDVLARAPRSAAHGRGLAARLRRPGDRVSGDHVERQGRYAARLRVERASRSRSRPTSRTTSWCTRCRPRPRRRRRCRPACPPTRRTRSRGTMGVTPRNLQFASITSAPGADPLRAAGLHRRVHAAR